jgi:hypothetical protein
MGMSYDAHRIAVQQHVQSNWTTTPILYDGAVPAEHTDEFIRINIFDSSSQQSSIGGAVARYRHVGVVVIEIYVRISEQMGSGNATRYGDTLAALFRGETVGDALFRSPTVRQVGRDEGWYRVNVEIPFQRDECF